MHPTHGIRHALFFEFRDELFSLSPVAPGVLSILIWIPLKTLHIRPAMRLILNEQFSGAKNADNSKKLTC
jgi:hypothetical protein